MSTTYVLGKKDIPATIIRTTGNDDPEFIEFDILFKSEDSDEIFIEASDIFNEVIINRKVFAEMLEDTLIQVVERVFHNKSVVREFETDIDRITITNETNVYEGNGKYFVTQFIDSKNSQITLCENSQDAFSTLEEFQKITD